MPRIRTPAQAHLMACQKFEQYAAQQAKVAPIDKVGGMEVDVTHRAWRIVLALAKETQDYEYLYLQIKDLLTQVYEEALEYERLPAPTNEFMLAWAKKYFLVYDAALKAMRRMYPGLYLFSTLSGAEREHAINGTTKRDAKEAG